MVTYKLEQDGTLINTIRGNIYQTESLMDKLHFLLPKKYKEQDLEKFEIILKYINPANFSKMDILVLNNSDYKNNYLEYILPVTTEMTKIAGKITFYISMYYVDNETKQKYLGHSAETTIEIISINNYFTDENSLHSIDKQILELQEIAKQYDKSKADSIRRVGESVYLTSNGEKIGEEITISNNGEGTEDFPVVEF